MDEKSTELRYADLDDRMKQIIRDIHSAEELYLDEDGNPDLDMWAGRDFTPQALAEAMLTTCREWQVARADDDGEEPPREYGRREFGFALGIYYDVVEEMLQERADFFKLLADKWVAVYPECATLGEVKEMSQKAGRA